MSLPTSPLTKICLLPRLHGLGGPAAFRARLADGLAKRGVGVTDNPEDAGVAALLVIGGAWRVLPLLRARQKGIRVVQRLNGMNWIHRKRRTGVRHYLRSEANNLLLATIRANLADGIVYQSLFSRDWWNRVYRRDAVPTSVVYNAVDLEQITPAGPEKPPGDYFRLLLLEGRLGGGNEQGLQNGVQLAQALARDHGLPVELAVVGDVPETLRARWQAEAMPTGCRINWLGVLQREQVPAADRSAHLLFSADLNAACPNAVIEALACGLPVVAFDTGALGEMVQGGAGEVVPWGSDYWNLEPPDIAGLARAAAKILAENAQYRIAARARAEAVFGLDKMVAGYLQALLGGQPR